MAFSTESFGSQARGFGAAFRVLQGWDVLVLEGRAHINREIRKGILVLHWCSASMADVRVVLLYQLRNSDGSFCGGFVLRWRFSPGASVDVGFAFQKIQLHQLRPPPTSTEKFGTVDFCGFVLRWCYSFGGQIPHQLRKLDGSFCGRFVLR